jgi:hypothetical protein
MSSSTVILLNLKKPMKLIIVYLLFFITLNALGKIFEYHDSIGNLIYSDQLPFNSVPNNTIHKLQDNAYQVLQPQKQVSSTTIHSMEKLPIIETTASQNPLSIPPKLSIVCPNNQQIFWNQQQINIKLMVTPEITEGYTMQVLVDGIPQGPATARTDYIMENPSRGAHTIKAQLLGLNGEVLASQSVTIFIHIGTTFMKNNAYKKFGTAQSSHQLQPAPSAPP